MFLLVMGVVLVGVSGIRGVPGGDDVDGVGGFVMNDSPMRRTRRRAVKISSSVKRSKGSRLLRIVPVKRVGSWGTMVIDSLRS